MSSYFFGVKGETFQPDAPNNIKWRPIPKNPSYEATSPPLLKKKDSSKSNLVDLPEYEEEEESDSPEMQICAATIPKLIDKLANPEFLREFPSFEVNFMRVFRLFVSPKEFLGHLQQRWNDLENAKASNQSSSSIELFKKRIVEIIIYWVKEFGLDFEDNTDLIENTKEFARRIGDFCQAQSQVEQLFNSPKTNTSRKKTTTKAPETLWKATALLDRSKKMSNLLQFHPEEVARQMSLVEQEFYLKIQPHEFLKQAWNKDSKHKKAPNVVALIERFNKMSKLVAWEIVGMMDIQERVKCIENWIDIAEKCREIGNFFGIVQIISALSSSHISRLHNTWNSVSADKKKVFHDLETLSSSSSNFKIFRADHDRFTGPCIPFIAMYLIDLTFLDEGSPSYLENGLLNYSKFDNIARVIEKILKHQKKLYPYAPVDFLQEYLKQNTTFDDKKLYQMSTKVEPRGSNNSLRKKKSLRVVKEKVTNKAKRYQSTSGKIDITYIDDRVLIMPFPKRTSVYVKFLEGTHGDHYRVYNLSEERSYDKQKFRNQVRDFPIFDHESPAFTAIQLFLEDLSEWLEKDPLNVAAIHCKGKDRNRTAQMLACWLIDSRRCYTTSHAIQHFNVMVDQPADLFPGQIRYINYVEQIVKQNKKNISKSMILDKIFMYTLPQFGRGEYEPFFSIGRKGKQIFRTKSKRLSRTDVTKKMIEFDCGQVVTDDLRLYYYRNKASDPIFSVSLHLGFVSKGKLRLLKRDIDIAHKDKESKHFRPDFKIELSFKERKKQQPKNVKLSTILKVEPFKDALSKFLHANGGIEELHLYDDAKNMELRIESKKMISRTDSKKFLEKHKSRLSGLSKGSQIVSELEKAVEDDSQPSPSVFKEAAEEAYTSIEKQKFNKFLISTTYNDVSYRLQPTESDVEEQTYHPTCAQCMTDIVDDNFLRIGNFTYHWNCLVCSKCGIKQVDAESCVIKDDQLLCTSCEKNLFVSCYGCGKPITTKRFAKLPTFGEKKRWHDGRWHYSCFRCAEPNCTSLSQKLEMKDGRLLCKRHASPPVTQEEPKLQESMKIEDIEESESESESESEEYWDFDDEEDSPEEQFAHENEDNKNVSTESQGMDAEDNSKSIDEEDTTPKIDVGYKEELITILDDSELSFVEEDDDEYDELCKGCQKPISGAYVIGPSGSAYHDKCFVCSACKRVLHDHYVVSFDVEDKFFCNDHSHLAAKRIDDCFVCGKAIVQGITFLKLDEKKSAHKECFACRRCRRTMKEYSIYEDRYYCGECSDIVVAEDPKFYQLKEATLNSIISIQEFIQTMESQCKFEEISLIFEIGHIVKSMKLEFEKLALFMPQIPIASSFQSTKEDRRERLFELVRHLLKYLIECCSILYRYVVERIESKQILEFVKATQGLRASISQLQEYEKSQILF